MCRKESVFYVRTTSDLNKMILLQCFPAIFILCLCLPWQKLDTVVRLSSEVKVGSLKLVNVISRLSFFFSSFVFGDWNYESSEQKWKLIFILPWEMREKKKRFLFNEILNVIKIHFLSQNWQGGSWRDCWGVVSSFVDCCEEGFSNILISNWTFLTKWREIFQAIILCFTDSWQTGLLLTSLEFFTRSLKFHINQEHFVGNHENLAAKKKIEKYVKKSLNLFYCKFWRFKDFFMD